MRHLKGGVADFPGLLAEDGAQQALLRGQLGLALRSYLSYQLIQVFQGILAHARHIAGNLFRSQLGIAGFCLILLNVDRGIYILLNQALG